MTSEVTEESPVLQCVRRQYSYFATNNIRDGDDVYQCNGTVTVFSCWGRCDTHEVRDQYVNDWNHGNTTMNYDTI